MVQISNHRGEHAGIVEALLRRIRHADAGVHLRCRARSGAGRTHVLHPHRRVSMPLREAIAAKIDELHRVPYRPSEVMATVGASMAIYAAIRACRRPRRQRRSSSPPPTRSSRTA